MRIGCAKIAGLIALTYAIVFFGGIFFHYFLSGDLFTLKYSLGQPRVWLVLVATLVLAWGLLQRYVWAWWLSVAGVLVQLYGSSSIVLKHVAHNNHIPTGVLVVLALLISFLVVLLIPRTRKECSL